MTKHVAIDASGDAAFHAMCRALQAAVSAAERLPDGQRALGEALCAALDTVGAGAPRYEAFGDMRESARWWADCASPVEIELYMAAALRRASDLNRSSMAVRARKRVFMDLWNALSAEDQAAFLAKVKPPALGDFNDQRQTEGLRAVAAKMRPVRK